MGYLIKFKKSADKDLRKLPRETIKRIIEVIEQLRDEPYSRQSKKLHGMERTYRLRVGDYRIIYQVDEEKKEIVIYYIRSREKIYEKV